MTVWLKSFAENVGQEKLLFSSDKSPLRLLVKTPISPDQKPTLCLASVQVHAMKRCDQLTQHRQIRPSKSNFDNQALHHDFYRLDNRTPPRHD